jgi:hypothetical protein
VNDVAIPQLPELPAGYSWSIKEFQGNEIQWRSPGTAILVSVRKSYRVFGREFTLRSTDYPAYVIDAATAEEKLPETVNEIMQAHARLITGREAIAKLST